MSPNPALELLPLSRLLFNTLTSSPSFSPRAPRTSRLNGMHATPRPIFSGADTEHGRPRGVGVPYWTVDSSAEEGAGGGGVDPDPLPASDLPTPLLSFDEFLFGAAECGEGRDDGGCSGSASGSSGSCASDSGGGGGGGGGGREVRDGRRNRPGDEVIHFEPTPFDHPVFIMFSSGTTGLPKCMVHGAGGACGSSFRFPCERVLA